MQQPEFDDLDGEMVEDLVAQYHFGGGNGNVEGEEQGAGEGQVAARGPDGKPKTRKQVRYDEAAAPEQNQGHACWRTRCLVGCAWG